MADSLDWDFWRTFLAVAEEGSLSGAARRLRLTQPTIGRHIDALEQAFGAALFTRAQNGLTPTALGLSLVPHAEGMAASAAALSRTASAEPDAEAGVVRISASEIVGIEVLPAILAEFSAAHPRIAIELDLTNRNADLLRRDADIAVRMIRPQQDALVATRLGGVGIGLFAHRRYAEASGLPQSLAELPAHRLIGVDRNVAGVAGYAIGGKPVGPGMFSYRCDSDVAQLAALRAGIGIGICQLGVAARDPALIPVLPAEVRFELEMWLAMHKDLRTSRRVRLAFDHLAKGLREYAGRGSLATDF